MPANLEEALALVQALRTEMAFVESTEDPKALAEAFLQARRMVIWFSRKFAGRAKEFLDGQG